MSIYKTSLNIGQTAYVVERTSLRPDFGVVALTVGQIRVTETSEEFLDKNTFAIKVECMCIETGVGSGAVWEYGKNIFATAADASIGVIAHEKQAEKDRLNYDLAKAKEEAITIAKEQAELTRLIKKYAIEPTKALSGGAA